MRDPHLLRGVAVVFLPFFSASNHRLWCWWWFLICRWRFLCDLDWCRSTREIRSKNACLPAQAELRFESYRNCPCLVFLFFFSLTDVWFLRKFWERMKLLGNRTFQSSNGFSTLRLFFLMRNCPLYQHGSVALICN